MYVYMYNLHINYIFNVFTNYIYIYISKTARDVILWISVIYDLLEPMWFV